MFHNSSGNLVVTEWVLEVRIEVPSGVVIEHVPCGH